mmetsp:Transcript_26209/g.38961  ORF Transcript_26209/g.38961 Transcript_26209/m.38961 type:complete len:81 (+) Transcript_26209:308-550(+)
MRKENRHKLTRFLKARQEAKKRCTFLVEGETLRVFSVIYLHTSGEDSNSGHVSRLTMELSAYALEMVTQCRRTVDSSVAM